jgi:hypothetical protein
MIELPKPLPENPSPWGALYGWLNRLRECVQSVLPAPSSTIRHARTSMGTSYQVDEGEGGGGTGGQEPTVVRWG